MLGLILKRSALLMTGTVGSAVLSFAQSIFLTRALTPDLVGVWAIGGSVAMVVFGLLGFRSIDAVNRSLALLPEGCRDLRGAVITSALAAEFAAASVCLALLLAGSSWLMPHLSSSADAVAITLLQAVSIFFLWMDRPFQALCRTTGSYRRITQIALMSGTVKLLATMGLFALGELTLMRFGYLQVAISALTFMAHGASMNQFMARNLSIGFSDLSIATAWRHRRNLNCFWNLMIASFWSSCCSSVFKQIDVILLGAWRGDADAGLYRVAKSLATLAQTVGSTLAFSIFTEFNDLLSRRAYDELRHEIGRTVRLLLPMAVVLNLGGIALHWLIPFIYGPQYAGSASLLQMQLLGVTFGLVLFWGFPLLVALGGEWTYLTMMIAGIIIQFSLSYLLLPRGEGAMPMAIIYSICWGGLHTALAVVSMRLLRRRRRAHARSQVDTLQA